VRKWWILVLGGGLAWAQAKPAHPQPSSDPDHPAQKAEASQVGPNDTVLTIKGICDPMPKSGDGGADSACQTIVTRAQFEQLVQAIQPKMDKQTKQHLASSYPQFLVMTREAEKRGLDKTSGFAERMRFARLQILSQELVREIQEDAARVPENDIADYYQKHLRNYEQAGIERVVVPKRREIKADAAGAGDAKDSESAMTRKAEELRARAAAGESFIKLQKEAYEFAGVSGNTEPNPNMGKLRRQGLPPGHAPVFDLKAGEVSALISDATGNYIYKVDSKETQPLDAVKPEISNVLRRERVQEMMKAIQQRVTTDVNHAYFGDAAKEDDD
jgi:hypothetical protein